MSSKKEKSGSTNDETLKDESKKIVIGTSFLAFVIILILSLQIYTTSLKSSQANQIRIGKSAEQKSDTIIAEMAQIGKETKDLEYKYLKSLETIMSPIEFQNFKNSISGLASKNSIFISVINEGKKIKVREYNLNSINLELISNYSNYVNFKKDIAKTPFRINFDKEIIVRENPSSSKIKINAKIDVIVFDNKDKLFKEKKKFIEQMKKAEEKKLAREKKLKELQESKSGGN